MKPSASEIIGTVKEAVPKALLAGALALGSIALVGCDDANANNQGGDSSPEAGQVIPDAPNAGVSDGPADDGRGTGPIEEQQASETNETYASPEAEAQAIADVFRKHGYPNVTISGREESYAGDYEMININTEYDGKFYGATIFTDDNSSEMSFHDTNGYGTADNVSHLDQILNYVN